MSTVKIEVTSDDIASGRPCSQCQCPIARAMGRLLASPVQFGVRGGTVAWADSQRDLYGEAELPWPAIEFILRFDRGDPVEPFGFEIDLPGEILAAVTT